jgi:hypothetical protein
MENALAYYGQVHIKHFLKRRSRTKFTLGLARVEVTETDKHTSLLWHVTYYIKKRFMVYSSVATPGLALDSDKHTSLLRRGRD